MEKISKISKTVDKVLKVCYWLLAVMSVIAIVSLGLLYVAFNSEEDLLQETWTINAGNLNLELAEQVVDDVQIVQTEFMVALVTIMVGVSIFCYTIKLLRKILAPMILEKPFVGTVSGDLRKLGWVMLCGGVVMDIVENVGNAITYAAFDVQRILLSEQIVSVDVDFNFVDVKTILLGVLVLLLSHVFSYGEKLQQQDDETL